MMNTSPTSSCGEDLNYAFLNTKQPSFFFVLAFVYLSLIPLSLIPPPYPKGGLVKGAEALLEVAPLFFLFKKLKKNISASL